ncbi:MAG: hypothetical protein H3C63_16400 [Candidatus Omnitrophica bacterium]|jgi:hypothetical protein|nr:hypothetical protein [Candidatus Omnitrophota bacterium]MDX9754634.1 hypothetical protein [bacterium]
MGFEDLESEEYDGEKTGNLPEKRAGDEHIAHHGVEKDPEHQFEVLPVNIIAVQAFAEEIKDNVERPLEDIE